MPESIFNSPLPVSGSERLQRALKCLAEMSAGAQSKLPHGEQVAEILRDLGADEEVLIAALLADSRCEARLALEDVGEQYGTTIQTLVRNVRELNRFQAARVGDARAPEQSERLRRLLLAIINDVRAVLIKLAYRLVRLRHLEREPAAEQQRVARETLDIFAPLANRLGIAQLKWEMEDLAFRYLEPAAYKQIARQLEDKRAARELYVSHFLAAIKRLLEESSIKAEVSGRPKHIYSIWKKLQRKNAGIDELYDLRALRVIVESVGECYAVLGLVHTHWHTIPHEFDDYIANPKPNGYQSLHTVVMGPEDKPVEVQIRTRQMNDYAERGFAAHWRYKEAGGQDSALQTAINALRSLMQTGAAAGAQSSPVSTELFPGRVFVLTPKGEVVELGKGATPLDFAYAVHTEVGHRCRGAKVNGHIVPLTYQLQTGEQVEALTAKHPAPSRDWMNPSSGYLASSGARAKVRAWWHLQDYQDNIETGRRILDQVRKRWGLESINIDELVNRFSYHDEDSLMVAIGRGDIRPTQLDALYRPALAEALQTTPAKKTHLPRAAASVGGVSNLLSKVARCCKPVPGDDVIGYITQGQGITVHRRDCSNILHLTEGRRERLVEVKWGREASVFPVTIKISALDRAGLLRDIAQEFSSRKINLLRADTYTDVSTQQVRMSLSIQVRDNQQLEELVTKLCQVKSVLEAHRA